MSIASIDCLMCRAYLTNSKFCGSRVKLRAASRFWRRKLLRSAVVPLSSEYLAKYDSAIASFHVERREFEGERSRIAARNKSLHQKVEGSK